MLDLDPAAAVVGAACGAALSAAIGTVMQRFFADAGVAVRSTVTIALWITLLAGAIRVFGNDPVAVPEPLPGVSVAIGSFHLGGAALLIGGFTIALAWGLEVLLGSSRLGLRLRALAERPSTAALVGVPVTGLAVGVWALTGAVSTVAILFIAPGRPADLGSLSMLVLPGLAAALVGGFRNVGAVIGGGLAIGLIEGLASAWPALAMYRQALPLAAIVLVLSWSRRKERWDAPR